MQTARNVRVTEFGRGRHDVPLSDGTQSVAQVLATRNIETAGRRLAVNGQPAGLGTSVLEGDEVTVVPRVHGG